MRSRENNDGLGNRFLPIIFDQEQLPRVVDVRLLDDRSEEVDASRENLVRHSHTTLPTSHMPVR